MERGREFFDRMACEWDEKRNTDVEKLTTLVDMIGLRKGDAVLDVGSGTGVLIPLLLAAVGTDGHITAADYSVGMTKRAIEKYGDIERVEIITADIMSLIPTRKYAVVVCCNCFPHIEMKNSFLWRMKEFLEPTGKLVIMHDIPRDRVNAIHSASETVKDDRLVKAQILSEWMRALGYDILSEQDNDRWYFVCGKIKMS